MGSSRGWRIWSGLLPFTVTWAVTSMTVFHGNKVIIDQEHCISYASNQSTHTVDCRFFLCIRKWSWSFTQIFFFIVKINHFFSLGCFVPPEELDLAKAHKTWWQDFLGPYYRGFFDATGTPKQNFKKIQHLKIWDTLLTRYPKMIVVWAHLGLSKVKQRIENDMQSNGWGMVQRIRKWANWAQGRCRSRIRRTFSQFETFHNVFLFSDGNRRSSKSKFHGGNAYFSSFWI